MDNIIEANTIHNQNGIFLETNEHYFIQEISVPSEGYYEIEFTYQHNDWEAYLNLEITHSDGELAKLLVGFPHGKEKTSHLIFFTAGKNILHFSHCYSLGIHISYIKNKGKVVNFPYEISPKNAFIFLDNQKALKIYLRNYKDRLVKIETASGINLLYELQNDNTPDECKQSMMGVCLDNNTIFQLGEGAHSLYYYLESGNVLEQKLTIRKNTPKTKMQVINFDIGQANSTLIFLPNGKKLLVDSGTEKAAREKIIPWFEKNSIKIDYYLLTHFHGDHNGCRDEFIKTNELLVPNGLEITEMIKSKKEARYEYLKNYTYFDSTVLCYYDELHKIWDLGGVKIDILNSRFDEKGEAIQTYNYPFIRRNEHNYENATSVSFMLVYNGFRYYHGADNYAYVQERYMYDMIRAKRTHELNCDWFYANHHFVCDISATFINTLNPKVVYVTNEYIYHRTMYTKYYKEFVRDYYFADKRLQDTLISSEVGNVKVCINSGDDWYYETVQDEDI